MKQQQKFREAFENNCHPKEMLKTGTTGAKFSRMDQVKFVEDNLKADHNPPYFSKAVSHKFYLAHSWMLCYNCI